MAEIIIHTKTFLPVKEGNEELLKLIYDTKKKDFFIKYNGLDEEYSSNRFTTYNNNDLNVIMGFNFPFINYGGSLDRDKSKQCDDFVIEIMPIIKEKIGDNNKPQEESIDNEEEEKKKITRELMQEAGIKPKLKVTLSNLTNIKTKINEWARLGLNLDTRYEIKQLAKTSDFTARELEADIKRKIKENIIENENSKKTLKEESETKEAENIEPEVLEKFKSLTLMEDIKEELNKDHLEDDNLKMTGFLIGVSSLSNNPSNRMSMAVTGPSSGGKDNMIKTVCKHMPSHLFLTGATQPAIEDEAMFSPILALSEMNLFREGGANKGLLEVVKQRTEGGTSAMKKDAETQFKTTKHEKTEQGTVFYGTTDAEMDEEMETRFIYGSIKANHKKVEHVNRNTINTFSNPLNVINYEKKDSWIKKGLIFIKNKEKNTNILIPFSHVFDTLINKKRVIDSSNPRSMRDLKRLLSLISATTLLNSQKRTKVSIFSGETKNIFLISEPEDLLETLKYTKEFFNSTYNGMDSRMGEILSIMDSEDTEWVERDLMQRTLNKSRNTIKAYCQNLADRGFIEGTKGSELNYKQNTGIYNGNKIYYKRCQKGVKKELITCQLSELKALLDSNINKINKIKEELTKGNDAQKLIKSLFSAEIDTFSLTPLKKQEKYPNELNKEDNK